MAFCPICEREFPPGSRCVEHGGLVETIPGVHREPADDPWVRVATVGGDVMARSWAELLENNGIQTVVKPGGPGFSFGAPPPFGFPCYLYVRTTALERATAILEGYAAPGSLDLDQAGTG